MMKLRVACFSCSSACAGVASAADQADWRFITRRGDQLFDGDRPFRFISFNIPNLMVIEDVRVLEAEPLAAGQRV